MKILSSILGIFLRWFRLPSWMQIVIALIAGVLTGLCLGQHSTYIKPVGTLFMNAIHLIVAPIVFTSIVGSIVSLKSEARMASLTGRAFLCYGILMLTSATIGCLLAYVVAPGSHFHPEVTTTTLSVTGGAQVTAANFIENLLPSNPVVPFLQGNVLQLVLFALLFGAGIRLAGDSAKQVRDFFIALNKVVYQITALVIGFAPYGIFSLIAYTVGHYGLQVITPLLSLVGTVYLGCLVLLLIVYVFGLIFFCRMSPVKFYSALFPALAFAFTSSSSAATLPVTMQCAEKKIGIPEHVARFLLPLGTSFSLNGLSVYLSVATVFAANLYGVHLGLSQFLTIIMTITLTAMGAAAVPGSALIVMGAVMSAVGIPLEGIAMIAGVDRLNDMMQTSTNVAGDVLVALLVSKKQIAKKAIES